MDRGKFIHLEKPCRENPSSAIPHARRKDDGAPGRSEWQRIVCASSRAADDLVFAGAAAKGSSVISAVHFQNFKALREASVRLEQFNLCIGPNGSGKTSLIQALLQSGTLAAQPGLHVHEVKPRAGGPLIEFTFHPPYAAIRVRLMCVSGQQQCDQLVVDHPPGPEGEALWSALRTRLVTIRGYLFDHYAMAVPAKLADGAELTSNAGNLAAVLARRREQDPSVMARFEEEFCRIMPEFSGLDLRPDAAGHFALRVKTVEGGESISAEDLSQGALYLLAILALSFDPQPPALVCLEEADRGVHPRLLREVRDALYRPAYPKDCGLDREPVQVVTTTHSPYLLDLFREHPEEIVLASKRGPAATFERLSDRADLVELIREAHLGDLWYSGILGGVPGEG